MRGARIGRAEGRYPEPDAIVVLTELARTVAHRGWRLVDVRTDGTTAVLVARHPSLEPRQ